MKALILVLFTFISLMSCERDSSTSSTASEPSLPVEKTHEPLTQNSEPSVNQSTTTVTKTFHQQFMELINNHRVSIGAKPLIDDSDMSQIAEAHSQQMADGVVSFGHTNFSGRCSDARNFLGGGNLCAENVAMGQKTPQDVFNSWMNSSGHRANIENKRFTHSGFGFAKSVSGKYYWTHLFLEHF